MFRDDDSGTTVTCNTEKDKSRLHFRSAGKQYRITWCNHGPCFKVIPHYTTAGDLPKIETFVLQEAFDSACQMTNHAWHCSTKPQHPPQSVPETVSFNNCMRSVVT